MVAGNRVEFKTKVAGISQAGLRLTFRNQPARAAEAMHKRGCEGGLEMAAGVQDALVAILGEEKLDQMTQGGLYRRDIY